MALTAEQETRRQELLSKQGITSQEIPPPTQSDFGRRADNTLKGLGFFGELQLPDGGVATEFSIGVQFDGKETQIPTLVPTLTEEERNLLTSDIIPNRKSIPDSIVQKAVDHAKFRLDEGKSPFAQQGEQTAIKQGITPQQESRRQELLTKQQDQTAQLESEVTQTVELENTASLLEQLKGRLPGARPIPQRGDLFVPKGVTSGIRAADVEEAARKQAFGELTQKGFTPEQIELSLRAEKILGGFRTGRTVGGIGGAIAATAIAGRFIPGPFDDAAILAALIASGGAGVGGVAGEAVQTGIEENRLIGRREALNAFATEFGTELGGRGAVRLGKFALSPLIKRVVPEAAALVDDFARVGGSFSPSELDKRFLLRRAEGFSRGAFGAKEIFQEFEEKQGKAVLAFADNIIESIGEGIARQTPEEIGQAFADGITRPGGRVFNILDELFDPLFKQVDELAEAGSQGAFRQARAGGPAVRGEAGRFRPARELQRLRVKPSVSTDSLKSFAKKQLATDKRLNGQFLSPAGKTKLEGILGLNEKLSFSDMRTLRSSFLKDARRMARDVDQSQGIIKQLAGITDKAIFDPKAAQNLSPEALNLLKNTNRLYAQAQKGLETTFSEKLAKRLLKNPSNVIKEVIPNNNPKSIRLLRESLVEPISGKPSAEGKALWNQLRQQWLADAVENATKTGVANPKVFDASLRKLTPAGLKELFPEKEIAGSVKKIQTIFETAGKVPPGATVLFTRGAQFGGVLMMWNSGKEGDFIGFTAGAALAIGPLAFAKLATNPKGIKFLTAGFKLKPGASGLVPNAVRMTRLLRSINKKEDNRNLRAARKLQQQRRKGVISGQFRTAKARTQQQFEAVKQRQLNR